jgi:hypothetical protein
MVGSRKGVYKYSFEILPATLVVDNHLFHHKSLLLFPLHFDLNMLNNLT